MGFVSDRAALPDVVLNLYLYPIGAWGLTLVALFTVDHTAVAIPLCYPLAVWQIALSAWWGRQTIGRWRGGELTREQANAGVRSVGHILAGSALFPGIVFLAHDPLDQGTWGTCVGVAAIALLGWQGVNAATRINHRYAHTIALTIAGAALPVNATGAVSVAAMIGLYDKLMPG